MAKLNQNAINEAIGRANQPRLNVDKINSAIADTYTRTPDWQVKANAQLELDELEKTRAQAQARADEYHKQLLEWDAPDYLNQPEEYEAYVAAKGGDIWDLREKYNAELAKAKPDFLKQQELEILATGGNVLMQQIKELSELSGDKKTDAFLKNISKRAPDKKKYDAFQSKYDQLVKAYGKDEVDLWLAYADQMRRAEASAEKQKEETQFGRDSSDFASWNKATGLDIVSGVGFIDAGLQKVVNDTKYGKDVVPVDYNTPAQMLNKRADAIRAGATEDKGAVGSFLYNTTSGLAGSTIQMALGPVGQVMLFTGGATDTMQSAAERGASDDEALTLGLIAGATELAVEKLQFDRIFGASSADDLVKPILKIFREAGAEGSEEVLTSFANTVADELIAGDKSELHTMYSNYIADGYSEEEAKNKALVDWAKGLGTDYLAGAFSGGVLSGGKVAYDGITHRRNTNTTQPTATTPVAEQAQPVSPFTDTVQQTTAQTPEQMVADAMSAIPTADQRVEQAVQDMTGQNKTAPVSGPVRVGRVTVLRNPYTGDVPVYTKPANKKNPSVGVDLVSGADLSIKDALIGNGNNEKGFASSLRETWENIFKKTGTPGRKVRVEGLSFHEKPYDVSLHKSLVGKIVSDGKATPEKLAIINIIDDVVKNGEYVGSTSYTPKNNKIKDTIRFDHFETPVYIQTEVDGKLVPKEYIVTFEVEVFPSEKNYRLHRVVNEMDLVPSRLTDTGKNLPQGDGTQDPSNYRIPNQHPVVKKNIGDMGAKTSQFQHEVRESRSKTTPYYYEQNNVPEEGRADNHYTVVHQEESLHNAQARLEQDYTGEVEYLRSKPTWSDEEMLEADMILRDLRSEAEQTGDWSKHREWAKTFKEHKTEAGRSLAILSMLNKETGDAILENAAVFLENADKGTDVNAVMQTVSELTTQYDAATAERNVDGLLSIIKESAKIRKTGFLGGKLSDITSKPLEWALTRLANYAKADPTAGTEQTNFQQFKVDDVVIAKDRGNYGRIVNDNGDGTYEVFFKAKTGHTATKTMSADMLSPHRKSGVTASDMASNPSSSAYSFLKSLAASSIESIASDTNKASVVDMAKTIRRNSMLSKVSTTFRNLVGNGTFDIADTVARDVSVPLDILLSKFTGTRSVAVDKSYFSEAKRKGMMDGLAMAVLETSLDLNARDQQSKYENGSNRTFKMSGNVVSKVLSTWEGAMGYGLYVTDEMNKGATSAEIQRGLDKLYEQGKIKDDSLRDGGQQEALYRTFQDDSALAKGTQKVKDAFGIVGEIELPFAKVPANLADRAIDYSPAGIAKSVYKIGKALLDAKKGEFTAAQQADLVQSIGRNITGGAIIAAATYFAAKGIIRVQNPGEKDEDKNKAADEKASGLTGTQINLSAIFRDKDGGSAEWRDGDTLMSIAFLEPFNAQLTIGALLAEDMANEEASGTIIGHSLVGALEALAEMPVFEAIGNTANSIKYSKADTKGGRIADGFGRSLGTNLVSSFIPNPVKGIAQGLDPYQRDLYSGETFGEEVADQFKGVFARDSLPIKQDVYGNDMKNENGFLNFMNSNILPGAITKYTETDLQNALRMMEEETGSTSAYLTKDAPSTVSVDGRNVELSDAQKQSYMMARGDAYELVSSVLQNSDMFQNLPKSAKQKAYDVAEDYAVQTAKESLNIGFDADSWVEDLDNLTGEELVNAVLQKTIESMANNKKLYGNKYEGFSEMNQNGTIDDNLALALLTDNQFNKYNEFCAYAKVPVPDYLELLGYANAEGRKQQDVKIKIGQITQDNKQRRALWCTLYSKNTIPGEWWN